MKWCWPPNIFLHREQIHRWVVMHQCTDIHPISTCTRAEEKDGGVLFSSMGRAAFWGMWGVEQGETVWRGLVINTPGPRSPGRLEARLVTRVNTRGTRPLTLLMGHRKPSMNWYPLCRIPPQDLSHQPPSPCPPLLLLKHTGTSVASASAANVKTACVAPR